MNFLGAKTNILKHIFFTTIVLASFFVHGQEKLAPEKRFPAGTHVLTPNFGHNLVLNSSENLVLQVTAQEKSSFGPVGLRYEYLLSDKVGFGGEFIYSYKSLSSKDASGMSFSSSQTNTSTLHLFLRANFHMTEKIEEALETELHNFDCYAYTGLGFGNTLKSYHKSKTPKLEQNSFGDFALKAGLGVRFFLLKDLTINAEVGFGTTNLSMGLSQKIR